MNAEVKKQFTRREMLRLGAGSLLALGLWPGALQAAGRRDSGSFHFLVLNDLHFFDSLCGTWFERAVRQMKAHREKPEFCVLAGDLGDQGLPQQIGTVRDIFNTLGIPVFTVPGNHDYLTDDNRRAYEQLFPGRINYRFDHKGWQFVAIDTTEGLRAFRTKVQPATLNWLDTTLPRLDARRPTVLISHFPLGRNIIVRPLNAEAVLTRFTPFNLQAVFCGHWHGFTERRLSETTLTTNRCCSLHRENHDGTKEKGYFLCRAGNGTISRTFVEVKPV